MKTISSRYVEFVHGTSSKFYRASVMADGSDFVALAEWGKIGTAGQSMEKYRGPNQAGAQSAADKVLAEKLGKGYVAAVDPQGSKNATVNAAQAQGISTQRQAAQKQAAPAAPAAPAALGVPSFPAMLAGQHGDIAAALADPDNYVFEEKFDGHRALIALLPGGEVEIRNRHGLNKDRIANTPVVEQALRDLGHMMPGLFDGTLIDGELVADSFEQTAHLLGSAGKTEGGLRFMAFDLPYLAGEDLRQRPWTERRAALEEVLAPFATRPDAATLPVRLTKIVRPHEGFVEAIWERGGEGIIIKRRDADYFPGGRFHWGKVKREQTADGVVVGFVPGQGKYAGQVGAVRLAQYRADASGRHELVEVAAVSGMTDEVRAALDDSWLGRVVEFEYQVQTVDRYRHPRWVRPRPDKQPAECEWEPSGATVAA